MNEFKDMLSYLRKREKMTQRELADKLHVSHGAIAMYETGKRMPTLEVEEAIADLFNVSLDVLRGRSEPMDFSLTQEEMEIIMEYRNAPKNDKDLIRRILAYYGGMNEN